MTTLKINVVAFPEVEVGLVQAYLRGLPSCATREVYSQVIRDFEGFVACDLLAVSRRQVEAYRAHLDAQGRAPATIAKHLSALTGYFDFLVDEGVLDKTPMSRARRPKVSDLSPRRALSQAEVQALLAVPDVNTLVGLRDLALLTALVAQGWRVSEALKLNVEDLAEEQGHRVATVHGKGGKTVRVPLAAATSAALMSWMAAAGITTGPLFLGVHKGGSKRKKRPWRDSRPLSTGTVRGSC